MVRTFLLLSLLLSSQARPQGAWEVVSGGGRAYSEEGISPGVYRASLRYAFPDADRGWRAPSFGLERSSDGGRTWVPPESPLSDSLAALCFPHADTGWAVTAAGLAFRTRDGGRHWDSLGTLGGDARARMEALDGTFAFRRSGDTLYRTRDGGTTWERPTLSMPGEPWHWTFRDRDTGYAWNQTGAIWRSEDGGASWSPQAVLPGTRIVDIAVRKGRIIGQIGQVFDRGPSLWVEGPSEGDWSRVADPRPSSQPGEINFRSGSVHLFGDTVILLDGRNSLVFRSVDRGRNWTRSGLSQVWGLHSLRFIDGRIGLAIGAGCLFRTEDGGASWESLRVDMTHEMHLKDAAFIDSVSGFALLQNGGILRTSDGGSTWTVAFQDNAYLEDIEFADARSGAAGGRLAGPFHFIYARDDRGVMVTTRDGGATWTRTLLGQGEIPGKVRTSDGGRTWAWDPPGLGEDMSLPVVPWKAKTGGGPALKLWPLPHPGRRFERNIAPERFPRIVRRKPETRLSQVAYHSPDSGWGITLSGGIFRTVDRGAHWDFQGYWHVRLHGLAVLSGRHAWAVGSQGTVLRWNPEAVPPLAPAVLPDPPTRPLWRRGLDRRGG